MRPTRVLALAGLSTTLLGTAVAEIESEFHVGYSTDYIFRGAPLGEDLYEFGLDFAGSGEFQGIGALDWSAGIWYASFEVPDAAGGNNASNNELDVYAEVSKSLTEMFSIAAGITNYSYFGNGGAVNDDIEPYLSIGAEVAGISLGAAAYFDGADNYAHDFYYELTAGYEQDFIEGVSGGVEAVLGIFDDGIGGDEDVYFGGTASLSVSVTEEITVSPYASVTFSDDFGDYFFGGVSIGFGF